VLHRDRVDPGALRLFLRDIGMAIGERNSPHPTAGTKSPRRGRL
jgi:hypothetical protein